MKNIWKVVPGITLLLLLTACSDVESDFKETLNNDSKYMPLCYRLIELGVSSKANGSLSIAEDSPYYTYFSSNLIERLKEADYLSKSGRDVGKTMFGKRIVGFNITEKGEKYLKSGSPLCFGKRVVTEIVEYTVPSDFGGEKLTEVTFKYEIEFNDLVDELNIKESLKNSKATKKAIGKNQARAMLIETSNGWKVKNIR